MASKKGSKALGVNRQCAELPSGSELLDLVRREIISDFSIYDPHRNRVDICTVAEREHGTIQSLGNNELDDTDQSMREYGSSYTKLRSTSVADPVKGLIPPIAYNVRTFLLTKGGTSLSSIKEYKSIRKSLEEIVDDYNDNQYSIPDLYSQYRIYYERNRQDVWCANDPLAAYKILKNWYIKEKSKIENKSTAEKILFISGLLGVAPKEIFETQPNDRIIGELIAEIDDAVDELVDTQKGSDAVRRLWEDGYTDDEGEIGESGNSKNTNNLDDYYDHINYPETEEVEVDV